MRYLIMPLNDMACIKIEISSYEKIIVLMEKNRKCRSMY